MKEIALPLWILIVSGLSIAIIAGYIGHAMAMASERANLRMLTWLIEVGTLLESKEE